MMFSPSPSELVRCARAELECIASSMRADDVIRLVEIARRLLDDGDAQEASPHKHDDRVAVND